MALNITTLADELKADLKAEFSEYAFTDDDWLNRFCRAVAKAIVTRIDADADIVLQAADITINPGTFKDSANVLLTGQGASAAVTLNGRIK